jgi:hypothetical protein
VQKDNDDTGEKLQCEGVMIKEGDRNPQRDNKQRRFGKFSLQTSLTLSGAARVRECIS